MKQNRVLLGEYVTEYSVKNKANEDIPVYSVTNSQGFCTEYFDKEVASKDKTTYKIVPRGYFAYNPSRINVGSVDWQKSADRVIVSPLYNVFSVSDELDQQYLFYFLKSDIGRQMIKAKSSGSVRDNLKMDMLKEMTIPKRTLQEQKECVAILDKLKRIISLQEEKIEKYDKLVKARFVELFGDMLLNSKKWPEMRLDEIADIVSGITKGRKIKEQKLFEVPYMAVSNVKDGYIDWTTVKTIMASQAEIEKYRLKPFDVLMTEGGDPDKVGRGSIIHLPPENCIHQNHIFRVRLNRDILLPEYMEQYLQQQKAKRYFLGCAKQTTGIASINMRQLTGLPLLIPEMQLQEEFTNFVQQVDKSKVAVQKALDKAQLLFDSLMQQYFG
jgi:type I restriction enzyme S subunit